MSAGPELQHNALMPSESSWTSSSLQGLGMQRICNMATFSEPYPDWTLWVAAHNNLTIVQKTSPYASTTAVQIAPEGQHPTQGSALDLAPPPLFSHSSTTWPPIS
jgi:hypothetical protein